MTRLPSGVWFHPDEFKCKDKDRTAYPEAWADRLRLLITMLDRVRDEFGKPLRVVSGYRTPAYNKAVRGAKFSEHVTGRAADVAPICPPSELEEEVERLNMIVEMLLDEGRLPAIGGVGYYPRQWVHLDVRPRPAGVTRVARWNGSGIGSEVVA